MTCVSSCSRSAHVAATRDEAVRFCSDVTEKALASLEPDTSIYVQDVAQALKEVWNCTLLLIKALYAFLKLVGEPLLRKLAQAIQRARFIGLLPSSVR